MKTNVRTLGLFSVLCIGINAIVGSGIYRLPGRIAHELGGASWAAFAVVGVLLVAVGLCFAEAGGMFSASGGPYVYTREAFGRVPAFVVGWMAWVTMVLSWAAVAHGVTGYLATLVTAVEDPKLARLVVIAMITVPGVLNYFGVRPGAYATNAFTIAKLAPLAIFVIAGLPAVDWSSIRVPEVSADTSTLAPFGTALFVALFAVQGFEVAPVPAGETSNPRRNVPIAVLGSLAGCALFYVLIQIVAFGTTPAIAAGAPGASDPWSARPLADAAGTFLGSGGATLMSVGACLSMMGFCVGSGLATPRFLGVLAEDRLFPRWLAAGHPRFGSPHRAIVATTVVTLGLSQVLDFDSLVDLANVAVTLQYVGTCVAVAWLRFKAPQHERSYRAPGGALLMPVLGVGVCVLLLSQAAASEFVFSAIVIAIGGALAAINVLWTRRRA